MNVMTNAALRTNISNGASRAWGFVAANPSVVVSALALVVSLGTFAMNFVELPRARAVVAFTQYTGSHLDLMLGVANTGNRDVVLLGVEFVLWQPGGWAVHVPNEGYPSVLKKNEAAASTLRLDLPIEQIDANSFVPRSSPATKRVLFGLRVRAIASSPTDTIAPIGYVDVRADESWSIHSISQSFEVLSDKISNPPRGLW